MSARVWVYGVPPRLGGAPVVLPPEVDEQLRLAHSLREDLVSLWQARQDALGAVWSSEPRIAAVEGEIAEAEAEAEAAAKEAAKERSSARSRGITASTARLKEARATIRDGKNRRRELISEVRPSRRDDLAQIEAEYRAAVKATYKTYCQDGVVGEEQVRRKLYWATWNDVTNHHRVAERRIAKDRAAGKALQFGHHRFDGSGSIAVQLQREATAPARSPAMIADEEGKWRNVLHLSPWVPPEQWTALSRAQQRRQRLGQARINVGGRRTVTVPVLVHRMLPADAEITGARLVARRVAGRRRVELHVAVHLPDPPPVTTGPAVAVHLGWRRDPDRGVQVATYQATGPLRIPVGLDSRFTPGAPVVPDTDRTGRVVLPDRWFARVDAHDDIARDRDLALDKVRASVVAWLEQHRPVAWAGRELAAGDVARWKAAGRFARLAMDWRDNPPAHGGDLAAELEEWRRADRLKWEGQAHGRAGALAHRDNTYRRVAAWLCGTAGKVVYDDTDMTAVARRPDPGVDPELPTVVEQRAARQRTLAAPARLRQVLSSAAAGRGVPEVTVSHVGASRTDYRCGHVNPVDGRYAASRMVMCDGCGRPYDQDKSATSLALAASGDMPPPGLGTARGTT